MGDTRNVGILAMEIYFPSQYVDEEKLEEFDGVTKGKYTIGLGQHKMGFCDDREDINSMCLTVVHRLIEKTQTDYRNIGRLEVGTETIIDKSKSVKSVLMQLFESSGNTDIEGIDTTNACYGGTSALFNAISWVESKSWDGRLAIVVAGDIAVYASGSARPTGGAGAVAMLVGPNAPLIIDNVRSTHMAHAYDFYKPDLLSEYPVVDGKLSIQCYLSALDRCYQLYCQKKEKLESHRASLEDFDYFCFHSPYCKLVQKSFARLFFNDLLRSESEAAIAKFIGLEQFRDLKPEDTYFNRELEQAFVAYSKSAFGSKTQPSLLFASQVGNMYTPSLYGGLISLFVKCEKESLLGKRIGMFSYGSGLAASLYSVSVTSDSETLERLIASFSDIQSRLDSRRDTAPSDFVEVLKLREETHHKAPYQPVGAVDTLFPGTYYLTEVDAMHRRTYARRPIDNNQRVMCNGL